MSTLMKQTCDVEETLVFTLEYDEGQVKTRVITAGDYVSIAYNKNGQRRVVNGVVTTVYATQYAGTVNKKDWYIIVTNDESTGLGATVRIGVWQILDVEVLHAKNFAKNIHTPNNAMRVTDIRIKGNVLQVSNNGGRTWKNVGSELTEGPVGEEIDIGDKVRAMIGSDQYANADEFVVGIVDIINDEVRKRKNQVSTYEEMDDWHLADATPYDSSDGPGYGTY